MTNEEKIIVASLYKDKRFHLTGSRYWNAVAPDLILVDKDTDVDFVTEYDETVAAELLDRGFTTRDGHEIIRLKTDNYGDGHTVVVLYHGKIQAIMKRRVDLYLKVQENITPWFYKNYMWKKYVPIPTIQNVISVLLDAESAKELF